MITNNSAATIHKGFQLAKIITRRHAKTFYFASLFLPKEQRYAAYAVYAVCRLSDDSVDEQKDDMIQELDQIRKDIDIAYAENKEPSSPLFWAFKETVIKHKIPKLYFEELLQGMQTDLEKNRYENYADLYQYCYLVAGVVGLIMLHIFGYTQPQATEHAINLGVAMQLTNILRDIKEDHERGRIYLPHHELKQFHLSEKDLVSDHLDKNFVTFMKFQIRRARQYYHDAMKGVPFIKGRRSRLVVWLMKAMYSGILKDIERHGYDVHSRRAHVSFLEKLHILLKVLIQGKYI